MFSRLPKFVKIVEVGPRDGLQNELRSLTVSEKVSFINKLSQTGLRVIETGSFVSPKWVPQMANSDKVFTSITRNPRTLYTALTPNIKGYNNAMKCRVDEVAVFASASETFSHKNINCTIKQSIERFTPLLDQAKKDNIPVRGYISCVMGCPYEGEIQISNVVWVARMLYNLGCYEISLGDTIGTGNPKKTYELIKSVSEYIPLSSIAVHFHDTYGQAMPNILTALMCGVNVVDSSVGGLGGCPYAKGATGNVATEKVVYMLDKMGIQTGIDNKKLYESREYIRSVLYQCKSRL